MWLPNTHSNWNLIYCPQTWHMFSISIVATLTFHHLNEKSWVILKAFFLSHSISLGEGVLLAGPYKYDRSLSNAGVGALTSGTVKNPYTISVSKTKDWLVTHPGAGNWNGLDRIRTQTLFLIPHAGIKHKLSPLKDVQNENPGTVFIEKNVHSSSRPMQ